MTVHPRARLTPRAAQGVGGGQPPACGQLWLPLPAGAAAPGCSRLSGGSDGAGRGCWGRQRQQQPCCWPGGAQGWPLGQRAAGSGQGRAREVRQRGGAGPAPGTWRRPGQQGSGCCWAGAGAGAGARPRGVRAGGGAQPGGGRGKGGGERRQRRLCPPLHAGQVWQVRGRQAGRQAGASASRWPQLRSASRPAGSATQPPAPTAPQAHRRRRRHRARPQCQRRRAAAGGDRSGQGHVCRLQERVARAAGGGGARGGGGLQGAGACGVPPRPQGPGEEAVVLGAAGAAPKSAGGGGGAAAGGGQVVMTGGDLRGECVVAVGDASSSPFAGGESEFNRAARPRALGLMTGAALPAVSRGKGMLLLAQVQLARPIMALATRVQGNLPGAGSAQLVEPSCIKTS
jgi:hypothetical protein